MCPRDRDALRDRRVRRLHREHRNERALGTAFAVRNLQLLRRRGRTSVPPATITVIFGGWFMLAPLLYDVGYLATGGVQLAGTLVATFAGYTFVSGLAGGE